MKKASKSECIFDQHIKEKSEGWEESTIQRVKRIEKKASRKMVRLESVEVRRLMSVSWRSRWYAGMFILYRVNWNQQ